MVDQEEIISDLEKRVKEAVDEQLENRYKFDDRSNWKIEIEDDLKEDGKKEALIKLSSENNKTELISKGDCIGYIVFELKDGQIFEDVSLMM